MQISHVAMLSLSSDCRIPDPAWAQAAALDRATMLREPSMFFPRIGKVTLKPSTIVRIMARVIAHAAPARGAVHLRDFEQAGIDKADAERHLSDALALARTIDPSIDSAVETA